MKKKQKNQFFIFTLLMATCSALTQTDPNHYTHEPWKSLPPATRIGIRSYINCSVYVGLKRIKGTINTSLDNSRIVFSTENGLIYASTNSGMSWTVYTEPGSYDFPIAVRADGIGFVITEEIVEAPKTTLGNDWYMVAEESNGQKLMAAVGTLPSPALNIAHAGETIIVSWPASFSGFSLQENSDLSSTNWLDVTNIVVMTNGQNEIMLPSTQENNFFRLRSK